MDRYKAVQIETNKGQLSKMEVIDVSVARIGLESFVTLIVITKKARFNILKFLLSNFYQNFLRKFIFETQMRTKTTDNWFGST